MSWERFSHGFAPAMSSPLRKTAPYGRPVHRLGDRAGRSPGSRVIAQLRPAFPVSQWPYGRGLAAYSCGGSHGLSPIREMRTGSFRVPSFVPGVIRGTSALKCSIQPTNESSAAVLGPDSAAQRPFCTERDYVGTAIGAGKIIAQLSRHVRTDPKLATTTAALPPGMRLVQGNRLKAVIDGMGIY